MKKFLLPVCLVATMGATVAAQATDFYATPMNHGAPTNLPGETLIPGMTQAMQVVNTVTQPILQPILAPQGAQPMAMESEPMMHRHRMMRHHMMHRRMMMKKKMMMKKEM